MLERVAFACLKISGKGQMLESLTRRYTGLVRVIARAIDAHAYELYDLSEHDAPAVVKQRFRVALACEDEASVNDTTSMTDSYLVRASFLESPQKSTLILCCF